MGVYFPKVVALFLTPATTVSSLLSCVLLLTLPVLHANYEHTCTLATRLRGPHPTRGLCGSVLPQVLQLVCTHGYRGTMLNKRSVPAQPRQHHVTSKGEPVKHLVIKLIFHSNLHIYVYIYIYIYIYIKFTEASHHNTLNMTQNRWM